MTMGLPTQYQALQTIESNLGDPFATQNPFGFSKAMEWDEQDAFPAEAVDGLIRLGFQDYYVPVDLGGKFSSAETFMALGRCIARRNMSVAVSFSTMLWSMVTWVAGDPAQKKEVAHWILQDAAFLCLAYSESAHGADLIANELRATSEKESYRLDGEKWPINRATTGTAVVLLARTAQTQSQRSHSLFVFKKSDVSDGEIYNLPRVKLFGLAGCDVSGIGFNAACLPASKRIGAEGHGVEIALKGFQITRVFCSALSLGVGDSLLRLATQFTAQRQLYQKSASDLPYVRSSLVNSFVSQLMAECTSICAARGLHLFPEQFSAWSSVAKIQCSELVDANAKTLAAVVGARSYMREEFAFGVFQKLVRDGGIVSIFDGSTPVCLDSLATLLPSMAKARGKHAMPIESVQALFNISHGLAPMNFAGFDLSNRGRDAVVDALPALQQALQAQLAQGGIDESIGGSLLDDVADLMQELSELDQKILASSQARSGRNTADLFEYALAYCGIHSASACLGLWLFNRSTSHISAPFFEKGDWLRIALRRRGRSEHRHDLMNASEIDALYEALRLMTDHNKMISIMDWPVA